ncbi:MAG: hypothetical protein ACYS0E_00925 [Planctomycetota bacterium]|jgi:hypothetical protein
MLKTILLTAAIAGMAPAADAGDIKVRFGLDSRGHIRVGVGLRSGRDHRNRHEVRHVDREWIPGHTDRVAYRVWVPARTERVLHHAEYRTRRLPCGRTERVLVSRRHYDTRIIPGHYVTRYRRVYHPGRWKVSSHVHHNRRHRSHGRDVTVRRNRRGRGIESLGRGDRRGDRRGDKRRYH